MAKTNTKNARVARIQTLDGPDGIHIAPEPVAKPGPGEVLLRMRALGLNRAEAMFARGHYLVQPDLPSRIGLEGVGVVTATGAGVEGVELGQRVAVAGPLEMLSYGLAGESALAKPAMLMPDVSQFSDAELAAFWVAFLTAYSGLVQEGRLRQGETALISAASSSAGLAAIQVAKHLGARVVATTRSGEKAGKLKAAGADRVIATDHESVVDSGEAIDVLFDAVAGPFPASLAPLLKPGARIVVYGVLSGNPDTAYPLFAGVGNNLRMSAFHLGYHVLADGARRNEAVGWVHEGGRLGRLKPIIDKSFDFEALPDAYRYLEAAKQVGKVVVTIAT